MKLEARRNEISEVDNRFKNLDDRKTRGHRHARRAGESNERGRKRVCIADSIVSETSEET